MKVVVKGVLRFEEGNFFMRTVPDGKFDYLPGQFVMVELCGVSSPFSIASKDKKSIDFLISTHPDGKVTPCLAKMKVGDSFEVSGPYGTFVVKPTESREIVFVAAGTGIAPFRAMVNDVLRRLPDKKVKLILGFRHDFYFEKEWIELRKNKNFSFCACCSAPKKSWKGLTGRVTEHLESELRDSKDAEVYLCGPPAMVESTKKILKKIGFGTKRVHVEKW